MSGVRQVMCHPVAGARFHVYMNLEVGISNNEIRFSVDQNLAMKTKTERRIFCYLCHSKIIAKREMSGIAGDRNNKHF